MSQAPQAPPPDDKDWTWVLLEPCNECLFDPALVGRADIAPLVRASIPRWIAVLDRPGVRVRPEPATWSALEYACHIRDVFNRFDERVRHMLDTFDPMFANWDQDETAIQQRYWAQTGTVIAEQLQAAGNAVAATFDGVHAEQWQRPGRRSNGSQFTVESLGRYFLHDLVHHLNDVKG